jgi:UPF0716 family protein affecting phage T7 exclusion
MALTAVKLVFSAVGAAFSGFGLVVASQALHSKIIFIIGIVLCIGGIFTGIAGIYLSIIPMAIRIVRKVRGHRSS